MKTTFNRSALAAIATCLIGATHATGAPVSLHVYAAGSLTGALSVIAKQYTADTGQKIDIVNGPAGLLRERIEHGADADVYISANMAHPQRLANEGKGTPAVVFARNRLCVTARPDVGLTADNLLQKLLEPGIKIGTSTPGADPGGDYAWQWFAKAETRHPGARKILESKAQKLVGGPVAPTIPGHANAAKYFMMQKKVDVFFGYCSSHEATPDPDLVKVVIPDDLSIPVDYGMSVLLHPAAPERQLAAYRFANYLMTPAAQHALKGYGFIPVGDVE
jgi:molybdate transport system substrate-binding protein